MGPTDSTTNDLDETNTEATPARQAPALVAEPSITTWSPPTVVMLSRMAPRVMMPADDCPMLVGLAAITTWLGWPMSRTKAAIRDGLIRVWSMPGWSMPCALKADLADVLTKCASLPGAEVRAPSRNPSERPKAR